MGFLISLPFSPSSRWLMVNARMYTCSGLNIGIWGIFSKG